MPKELHDALERQATKKGLTGDRRKAFVFGTMNRMKKKSGKKRGITMDHAAQALSARMKGGY